MTKAFFQGVLLAVLLVAVYLIAEGPSERFIYTDF
ncbi:hypothetical protein C7459_10184 [Tumebacillus permanentifrigoris]|uniref:D-Ala-teichoic acid biosynthesis protein n=1 Tax=Tumebacillus permanentifrigoris TaxID=378543 RepID=A0A316DDC3_9BACL|nr:hypothetical protein C7459_10184 [Tumebacillus permanentifrigoris]